MCNIYDDDNAMYQKYSTYDEDQEDCDFLKSLYPVEIMDVQLLIDDKCNELEYAGSMMFDKYLDRVRVEKLSRDISREKQDFDEKLIRVMLVNEMLRRRMRMRRRR